MFLKYKVDIPVVPGKLVRKKRGGQTYIEYEYERTYDPARQITFPKRASIGRVDPDDPSRMTPNENFLKYFPDVQPAEEDYKEERSPYLNIGTYVVLNKLIHDCELLRLLNSLMENKDVGLLLDLACCSIIEENNAGQYYPDYAYTHPLFAPRMRMYSASSVTDFFHSLKPEQTAGFLSSWNNPQDKRQRVYISYDPANRNCQAGDIDLAEYGEAKADEGQPLFNCSAAFDVKNREPLFYEIYPGSIDDVSQMACMVDKAHGYGYRNIVFVLDRGYFSWKDLAYMEHNGCRFLIMVKGMKDFIRSIIAEKQGSFETSKASYIDRFDVYVTSITRYLYGRDERKSHIHIYYSDGRSREEKQELEQKIRRYKAYLEKCRGKECKAFAPEIKKYFYLDYEKDGKTFKLEEENTEVIERELALAGYFAIVSSDNMTANEALDLYKSRDASEELFGTDKSCLGDKSMCDYTDDELSSKVFVQFIALILRSRFYTALKDKCERMPEKTNYMTVPAAIKELEKIVMIRHLDGVYRLDHAVTVIQKTILDAFGLDEGNVRYQAKEIEKSLKLQDQDK